MDAHNYRFGRVTERTLILAVEVGIYSLYFPISHYVVNLSPVDVSTAFDRALPLGPLGSLSMSQFSTPHFCLYSW